jgi:hypothetical protein
MKGVAFMLKLSRSVDLLLLQAHSQLSLLARDLPQIHERRRQRNRKDQQG